MTLDMIVFNGSGQGEVNFEALEAITSIGFVEEIKWWIDRDYSYLYSFEHEDYFYIYLNSYGTFLKFRFNKVSVEFVSWTFHDHDINLVVKAMGGTISW